jgi:hypothetical protein
MTFSDGHNTYTTDKTSRNTTGNVIVGIGSAPNITNVATTVQASSTSSTATSIAIYELSSVATSTPADKNNSNTGNGTSHTTNTTATTAQANEIAFACDTHAGSGTSTPTVSSPWTMGEDLTDATNMPLATAYQIVSSAQTFSATFTWQNAQWAALVQTYKDATAGGGSDVPAPLDGDYLQALYQNAVYRM